MHDDVESFLQEICSQDEFTGATPDNLPLYQAYSLLNKWRERARALLEASSTQATAGFTGRSKQCPVTDLASRSPCMTGSNEEET